MLIIIITIIGVLVATPLSLLPFSKRFDSSSVFRIVVGFCRCSFHLRGLFPLEAAFDFGHGPGVRAAHSRVAHSCVQLPGQCESVGMQWG